MVAFLTGGLALIYGVYLHYQIDKKLFSITKDWRFNWKKLSSKVYIVIGILIMRMDRFVKYLDENFEVDMYFSIIGFAFMLYGLNLHFKEKRDKKGSGNIE